MNIHFTEKQKFTQVWIRILFLVLAILPAYGIIQQIGFGIPFGDRPLSNIGLIIFSIVLWIILGFLFTSHLKTKIDNDSLSIHFFPFTKKRIKWTEVASVDFVDYGFVGGWGIRHSSAYGTVYCVKGRTGLLVVLKSGKKLVIGTQREQEIKSLMDKRIRPMLNNT